MTCGEGQQTREVICVGPTGEHLPDHACSGLERPASVKACRRPACFTHITWHVTEYGLVSEELLWGTKNSISLIPPHYYSVSLLLSLQCTRSCGAGVRERRVSCFDTDLNPYPEARCGSASRPVSVEECNSQPCPGAQSTSRLNWLYTHLVQLFVLFLYALNVLSFSGPKCTRSKGTWKHL